jgi:hypothetical protein
VGLYHHEVLVDLKVLEVPLIRMLQPPLGYLLGLMGQGFQGVQFFHQVQVIRVFPLVL